MRHFIQYHNTDQMGPTDDSISAMTKKPMTEQVAAGFIGQQLWLITSEIESKRVWFFLRKAFVVSDIEKLPQGTFQYRIVGVDGAVFTPPKRIDHLDWWDGFKKRHASFRGGLCEVQDEEFIAKLEEISKNRLW